MAAHAIVSSRLRDTGWMQNYAANVPAIIRYPSIDAPRACLADPDDRPYHESCIGPRYIDIVAFEV